jgi:CPA2 family monovalent cation:H+ antiporter-2
MMIPDTVLTLAATSFGVWDILWDILVLLAMALLLGTLAERLGQSAIVGYLLAGVLVGPNVLGWIATQAELFDIAETGVALLLFVIGLEFSPRRLLTLGAGTLKTGLLQVLLTILTGGAVAFLCGLAGREALVVGMMVAMSSTACVLRLLTDRAEIDSQHGRTALGILLIQDVAVVPMLLLVSVMAAGGTIAQVLWKLALSLSFAAVLIGIFYLLFNSLAPRLLALATLRKNRDLPVLLAVIMAAGSAWASHAVGLSPALGAFVAGMLLAVSPFATQIRADTRPLATVMITLFFASIGMFSDPVWLLQHWRIVASIALAIVVGKPLIIALLARMFGRPWRYAVATALCLAQVGEFSFVLATIAHNDVAGAALISPDMFHAMVSATILTLLATPYLVAVALRAGAGFERQGLTRLARLWLTASATEAATANHGEVAMRPEEADPGERADSDLVLIVGFGPAGQRAAEGLMDSRQDRMVVLDMNPSNIKVAEGYGLRAHLGDATQRDILEHAGVHQARIVVLTVPAPSTVRQLLHLVRDLAPNALIIVRCRYHVIHQEFLNAGAHEVVDEEDQVGRRLAAQVRKLIGGSGPMPG